MPQRFNGTVFKISSSPAEYKIDITADITFFVILPAMKTRRGLFRPDKPVFLNFFRRQRRGKKRVLMPEQTAGIHNESVAVRIQRNCLAMRERISGCVFNRQILQSNVMRVDKHGIRTKSPSLRSVLHQIICVIVICQNRIRAALSGSLQCDKRPVYRDFFMITTRRNENCHRRPVSFRNAVYRLRNGRKIIRISFFGRYI